MALINGRDDGRSAQHIYSDGLGGVVDLRLSAYDMSSPEESAKVWEKVKNGTYRGLEKLVRTVVPAYTTGMIKVSQTQLAVPTEFLGDTTKLKKLHIKLLSGSVESFSVSAVTTRTSTLSNVFVVEKVDTPSEKVSTATHLVTSHITNLSVSGEFNTQMVIGDPANILLTDALKDGWLGSWINVIPDGVTGSGLTRKSLVNTADRQITDNNGGTWSSATRTIDTVTNSIGATNIGRIEVYQYQAYAKQTKPSSNKPVLNGEAGVGDVFATDSSSTDFGVLFAESAIGKVTVNDSSAQSHIAKLKNVSIDQDGMLSSVAWLTDTAHEPIILATPNNNSPAVKALPYQISDNGQVSIGIQANELTWNDSTPVTVDETTSHSFVQGQLYWLDYGTSPNELLLCVKSATTSFGYMRRLGDVWVGNTSATEYFVRADNLAGNWGDDSEMKITATGTDTFVDLNGKTNLSVVHELSLPIGWSKSIARVSTQTAGVDL